VKVAQALCLRHTWRRHIPADLATKGFVVLYPGCRADTRRDSTIEDKLISQSYLARYGPTMWPYRCSRSSRSLHPRSRGVREHRLPACVVLALSVVSSTLTKPASRNRYSTSGAQFRNTQTGSLCSFACRENKDPPRCGGTNPFRSRDRPKPSLTKPFGSVPGLSRMPRR
jgi:hypothetical protein